jgi:hypothetical protein
MDSNSCNDCGHSWYPRTMTISARCPECRSTDVQLDRDWCEHLQLWVGGGFALLIVAVAVPPVFVTGLLLWGAWQGVKQAGDIVTS